MLSTVGGLASVVSIFLAMWLARGSFKKPKLRYAVTTTKIYGKGISLAPDVPIAVAGVEVEELYLSKIFLWHAGGATLEGEDIVPADPLCVDLDGDIHQWALISDSGGKNAVTVEQAAPKHLHIDFDYLDPADGLVLEIFHSFSGNIRIKGTVKGAKIDQLSGLSTGPREIDAIREGSLGSSYRYMWSDRNLQRVVSGTLIVAIVILILFAVMMAFPAGEPELLPPETFRIHSNLEEQRAIYDALSEAGHPEPEVVGIRDFFIVLTVILVTIGLVAIYPLGHHYLIRRLEIPGNVLVNDRLTR